MQILPALLYFIFTACWLIFGFLFKVKDGSEMFQTVVTPILETPWSISPYKTIRDVKGPDEVYRWLTGTWLNRLYMEYPQPGSGEGYCTEAFQCLMGEGDADNSNQCAEGLVRGEASCPSYMGLSESDCCQACRGSSCGNFTVPILGTPVVSMAAPDVSAACAEDMPSWLEELDAWDRVDTGTDSLSYASVNRQGITFCPERISKVSLDINTRSASRESPQSVPPTRLYRRRQVTVGRYNRVLMARLTMKRVKLVEHTTRAFNNAYHHRVHTDFTDAFSYRPDTESEASFGSMITHQYQRDKGFKGAGGFVHHMTFDRPKDEVMKELFDLKASHWFDLNQGSFVAEMLAYNGNIDRFLYVCFIFQHDFSGQTLVHVTSDQLDLSLHYFSSPETYVRIGIYLVVLFLFCVFVKNEIDDMTADYATYFSNFILLVHCVSLVLSTACIVQYLMIVFSYSYINFEFPLPDDPSKRAEDFEDLVNLANSMGNFMLIMSVNILLVLCRLVSLMTTIIPQSSVIFNTLGAMKYNLVAFFTMFAVMVIGFSLSGYFLFGSRLVSYRTFTQAFLSTLRLIQREDARASLVKGDRDMGNVYFIIVHLFFLIVLQILVSLLIYGYDQEKEADRLSGDADKYPLRKVWRSMAAYLRRYTNLLFRWFVSLQAFLFDAHGGPTARPNWDQVARLRDRRPTKPRIRNVDYGQNRDRDRGDDVDIATDVTLRAVKPWYPDGMMHYYVDSVKPEGPASDFKVTSAFRLVAIQRQGDEPDRKRFRDKESFYGDFRGDPANLLREAQKARSSTSVTLEFEGGVQPLSKECCALLLFIFFFIGFALWVGRVEESFDMNTVTLSGLTRSQWSEYNPDRIMSLQTMDSVSTISSWLSNAFLREYDCVTTIDGDEDCFGNDLTESPRPEWSLMIKGKNEEPIKAFEGSSMSYVPDPQKLREAPISQVVTRHGNSIGVMPNNFARLTLQFACFRANPNARWRAGHPYLLDPVFMSSNCVDEPCMRTMLSEIDTCLDSQGDHRQPDVLEGIYSGAKYTFSQKGTYKDHGGVAIGLGATRAEASGVLVLVHADNLFAQDTSSFVFEFVTYNANFDLFAYTTVKFFLKGTGKLDKEVSTSVFPLNIFSQGVRANKESWVLACEFFFGFYIICAVFFAALFCWDLSIQYFITVNLGRKWYMFLFDFFLEDWWNFVDLVSLILNIAVIESAFNYMLVGGSILFSRDGIRSWTRDYVFPTAANVNTEDPFIMFSRVAEVYGLLFGLASVNGLFLMLRLLKYLKGLTALRLVMTAISSALNELAVMTIVFLVMSLGFVCLFEFRYGVQYERFSTPLPTFASLFLYMNGRFDVDDLIDGTPMYFTFVFTIFEVVFIVIFNMFLAIIVFRWKDTRKDAQEVTLWGAVQKLKEPFSLGVLSFDKGEKQETTLVPLDADYWQRLSVLRHVAFLDESGRVVLKKEDAHRRRESNDGGAGRAKEREDGDGSDSEASSEPHDNAGGSGFNPDKEEDCRRFLKVFNKAHMEIASQMCRSIQVKRPDDGAGVGALENDEEAEPEEEEAEFEDDFSQLEMVGIIEEDQPMERAMDIQRRMHEKLEEAEHPAEEIWLDALVTILESMGALDRLQRFFRPLPMIRPTKPQELLNFKQKKAKMECRLNMFLRWLQEEARIKHYQYLKRMAQAKEKNLKQQSLVLVDYLDTLDEQIVSLEKDIKVLERKNAHMRSHVSPLL